MIQKKHARAGLSLLEMILATAILMTGALTIARLSFVTSSHAVRAQDDLIALQIAAYHLDQIQLKRRPAESVNIQSVVASGTLDEIDGSIDSTDKRITTWEDWFYSVSIEETRRQGTSKVQIDVFRFPASTDPAEGLAPPTDSATNSTAGSLGQSTTSELETDSASYHRSFVRLIPSPVASSTRIVDEDEAL